MKTFFCSDWLCVVVFSPLSVSLESVPSPPHILALGTLPTAQHNHHIRLHTHHDLWPTQVLHVCSVHTTVPLGLEETECEGLDSGMGLQELGSGKCPLCQPAKNHTNSRNIHRANNHQQQIPPNILIHGNIVCVHFLNTLSLIRIFMKISIYQNIHCNINILSEYSWQYQYPIRIFMVLAQK